MKPWQANAVLLLAGATWGMGFVAQSTAMDSIGPFLFIGLRFVVASLLVLPFALLESSRQRLNSEAVIITASNERQENRALACTDWLKFGLIGLTLFAGMATQQVGLLSTSVTNSGFLTGLYVVFTPFLAILIFREVPHPVTWISGTLALAGIYLLSGGNLSELVVGDVLTIGSAVFWSLQVVLIARFVGQSGRPLALSITQFATTACLALLVALMIEPIHWTAILEAMPQILYAGMFASGLAFTLQAVGQRYTSAPQAAILLSSEAPFAALFAFWWLNERIAMVGLLGCILILLAILSIELVPRWWAADAAA